MALLSIFVFHYPYGNGWTFQAQSNIAYSFLFFSCRFLVQDMIVFKIHKIIRFYKVENVFLSSNALQK